MRSLKWVIVILVPAILSCEDPISVDLPSEESFVVVEGWITDQPGPYRVKLSQTLPFGSDQLSSKVSNASVEIVNHRQERFQLSEDPANPGEYLTDSASLIGTVGHSYFLEIRWSGYHITSAFETMREVPEFDTLTFSFLPSVFERETLSFRSGYLISGIVTDPDTRNNYYRWKVSKNGALFNKAEDLILITDRFFNGKRFVYELSSILFQVGDTVAIEQYSLNQRAFDFLRNLNIQAAGLGKSSSTPPALVRGNLTNLNNENEVILGYFGASSISKASTIIESMQ